MCPLLSLNEITEQQSIFVYPNPANENLTLVFSNDLFNSSVNIYDLQGRLVFHNNLVADKTTIDISLLTNGIYFISVSNNDKTATSKFIKE